MKDALFVFGIALVAGALVALTCWPFMVGR